MRYVDIVVLSRFPEIFEGFRESVDRDAPTLLKNVGWDSALENPPLQFPPWRWWQNDAPFKIAQAANYGLIFARDHDVLYCGDDTRIIEPDTIKRLQELAYSDPAIGILSPRISGTCCVGPALSVTVPIQFVTYVGFVFVYIKREVIDKVGYLDERFEGYGIEDFDFCYRVRKEGFKIGVAKDITVQHGVNGHTYGSTFIKVRGEQQMRRDDRENRRRFAEKWGIENDDRKIMEFLEDPACGEKLPT